MFGVGLAAIPGGFYDAAKNYWAAKEQEDTQAAYTALGNSFMQMSGIPGAQPVAGPQLAFGQPGGGPPAPVAQPAPQQPFLGQGPSAATPGLSPQGLNRPFFGAPMQPQAPGMGMAPGPAAASGGTPMAATPPEPGPMASPMGPGGPQPGPQGGGQPQVPPQLMQQFGQPPYDWRQVVQQIAKSNPGAPPAVIARAAMMLSPFMNQQSQMELRMLNAQLAEQRALTAQTNAQTAQMRAQTGSRNADTAEGRLDESRRRHDVLEEQGNRRLNQADERLIEQKRQAMEREQYRATTLQNSQDKATRDFYRRQWENAMSDYHRTVRERIGAAGIMDAKTRKEMDSQLKEQEQADKERIDNFYKQFQETAPKRGPGTPDMPLPSPPSGQRDAGAITPSRIPKGQPAPAEQRTIDDRFGAASGQGKPIPSDQMDAVKKALQSADRQRRQQILDDITQQGFSTQGL